MRQFDLKKNEDEENKNENSKKSGASEVIITGTPKSEKRRGASGVWPYLLGLLLGLIVAVGAMWFISYRQKTTQKETATQTDETATTEALNENSNVNLNENTNVNENLNTNSSSETTTTLNKKDYSLQVQNGNGISGDAAKVKGLLEKEGWVVKSIANANNFNYTNTMVYYKPDKEEAAKAVAEVLKNNDRQTAMHQSTTIKYDIVIITGKK